MIYSFCQLRAKVRYEKQIFAMEGEFIPWKANLCHRRRICAVGDEYIS